MTGKEVKRVKVNGHMDPGKPFAEADKLAVEGWRVTSPVLREQFGRDPFWTDYVYMERDAE